MVDKIGDALDDKPELLIVHLGTNDLTNDINILNIEKGCHSNKEKITWNSLKLSKHDNLERWKEFGKIINSRLANYCIQKILTLLIMTTWKKLKIWLSRNYVWMKRVAVSLQRICLKLLRVSVFTIFISWSSSSNWKFPFIISIWSQ